MKRSPVLSISIILFCCATHHADAQDGTVSVNNQGSFTEHTITVNRGDAFSVDVNANTTTEIFDMYDMRLTADADNIFSVTGGDIQSPWTSSDAIPLGNLAPSSATYSVILPNSDVFGPGDTALVTLDIGVAANAPYGTYSLNITDAKITECRICPAFTNASTGPDFIVEVIPEPGIPTVNEWGIVTMTIVLLTAGTLLLSERRKYLTD